MTEIQRTISSDMMQTEKENLSLSTEIHHVSELLEELISLLKDGTNHKKEMISAELSPKDSEVMTVREAAAVMRISLPKMYEVARSGRVHSISVGRRVLISRSSLMALLREGERNGEQKR